MALYQPVCGCDNQTYSNACQAEQIGVNIFHNGTCSPKECTANHDCHGQTYCLKPFGRCNEKGFCTHTPFFCIAEDSPVTGCNGKQYSNPCMAAAAYQSIKERSTPTATKH